MAQNDWILDVLVDLKSFAAANDLAVLAEQLDDTLLVAAAEIAAQSGERPKRGGSGPGGAGGSH